MSFLNKSFNKLKSKFDNVVTKASVGTAMITLPALSYAGDYDTLTSSVNFDEVKTAILTVAAAVVGVYITYRAVKMILQAVRSA